LLRQNHSTIAEGNLMVDPLTKLAISYGTDKFGYHDYTPNYFTLFKHLKNKPVRLLEIGVGGYQDADRGGESLEVWRDFFPKGRIFGIDIQTKEMDLGDRVSIHKGSQVDGDFLADLVRDHGPFDIIIDDGSHRNEHVVESFALLYPTLAKDGIYVVEDVQTAFFPRFGGSLDLKAPNSVGYFSELAAGFDRKGRGPMAEISHISRFHNMVAMHKIARAPGLKDLFNPLKKAPVRVLEIGEQHGMKEYFANGEVIFAGNGEAKIGITALKKLMREHRSFDIVIDHRSGKKDVELAFETLFPALSDQGFYVASGAKSAAAGYFKDLFVAIDHCEMKVFFPKAAPNPLAKSVYAMTRTAEHFIMQKGANDYPSNFRFDFDHPQAVAALDDMEKVLNRSGKERGYLLFADIMTRARDEKRAGKMLKKLAKIGATSRPYYNLAARQARMDKDWGAAMELLQSAVKYYPDDYRIRSQLGSIFTKERDWPSAVEQFDRGIELAPRDPLLRIQLANVLARVDRLEDAVTSAIKACELSPEHAGHRVQLGRLQINAGHNGAAVETLEKAIAINSEIPNAHRQLSRAYDALGRSDEALKLADQALALFPENAEYKRWQDRLSA
jgi:tetratricopeptide (TPR) repeat protein